MLEVGARITSVIELWLVGLGVGIHLGAGSALALTGLGALAINALFFVPYELGSKEASWMAIYSLLASTAGFAVYASMVSRLRELVWIAVGLSLLGAATGVPTTGRLVQRTERG